MHVRLGLWVSSMIGEDDDDDKKFCKVGHQTNTNIGLISLQYIYDENLMQSHYFVFFQVNKHINIFVEHINMVYIQEGEKLINKMTKTCIRRCLLWDIKHFELKYLFVHSVFRSEYNILTVNERISVRMQYTKKIFRASYVSQKHVSQKTHSNNILHSELNQTPNNKHGFLFLLLYLYNYRTGKIMAFDISDGPWQILLSDLYRDDLLSPSYFTKSKPFQCRHCNVKSCRCQHILMLS